MNRAKAKASARPTQRDIALRAGVHRATVSLALKNHPGLPEETKAKIRRIADELGYAPDPMLSALASYRSRQRPASFQGTIAWLVNQRTEQSWDWRTSGLLPYYMGASEQAKGQGYQMEVFNLGGPGMSASRLRGIFRSRNIRGLLLCPQPKANTEIDFPWEDFSVVTFGYSLVRPQLHTVTATQFRNAARCVRELYLRGYRRIGFALSSFHDDRMDHNSLGGYLAETTTLPDCPPLPPLRNVRILPKDLARWYDKHKPDAVIAGPLVPEMIQEAGVPEEVGIACPMLMEPRGPVSGISEDPWRIGRVGLDYLSAMIQRGETGVPDIPQRVLVEGTWYEGNTVRPLR